MKFGIYFLIAACSAMAADKAGPAIPISAIAFHPAGKLLAVGGYSEVLLWDVEIAKLDRKLGNGALSGQVRSVAISKDGKLLAVTAGVPGVSGVVKLFDFDSGRELAALDRQSDEILSVVFSPDGKLVAAGGIDTQVRVWSVADRKLVATLKDHSAWINSITFSPNGLLLATCSNDKTLIVWDTATWKNLVQLPLTVTEVITSAAFSPDNEVLAFTVAGLDERAVRVYRTESVMPGPEETDKAKIARKQFNLKTTRPYNVSGGSPLAILWAEKPKQRMFVASTDKTIKVMANTGGVQQTFTGHMDWVYSLALSADGAKLATGRADGTVRLWNAVTGKQLATLTQPAPDVLMKGAK